MKVTLAQMNPVVGDIAGNQAKLIRILDENRGEAPDLVVLPELFLVGYPPKDLLERPWFIDKAQQAVQELARISARFPQTGILFGAPLPTGRDTGKSLFNSAVLVYQGRIHSVHHKSLLPTYDVFDERRHFDPAPEVHTASFKGETLGISICEDAWNDPDLWPQGRLYSFDPIAELAGKGATLFINISASPFFMGKEEIRFRLIRRHAQKHRVPFVFVNQIGGNDELVFDGRSLSLDSAGEPVAVCPSFIEDVQVVDTSRSGRPGFMSPRTRWPPSRMRSSWEFGIT